MKHDMSCYPPRGSDAVQELSGALPEEVEKLAPRMRQIAEFIYVNGGATVREIHRAIEGDEGPCARAIRTLLNRMVLRGIVKRRPSGRHSEVAYLPAILTPRVRAMALGKMIEREFDGSAESALITAMRMTQSTRSPDA